MAEEELEEAVAGVVMRDSAGTAASGTPLTLEEKEALVSARAEEKRSAVRREALGWDRYDTYLRVVGFLFGLDLSRVLLWYFFCLLITSHRPRQSSGDDR